MGKRMKSYLVFTTVAYRVVLFLLAPLAFTGLQVLLAPLGNSGLELGLSLTAALMTQLEITMDYWAFGGVAVKDNGCLEYLKTSARGLKLMKMALWQNIFRVFAECLLVLILGVAAHHLARGEFARLTRDMEAEEPVKLLMIAMAVYFVTVSGQLITRHFDSVQINLIAGVIANVVLSPLLMMATANTYFDSYYVLAVLTILSVSVSVFGLRWIMTGVEEGYYDKEF